MINNIEEALTSLQSIPIVAKLIECSENAFLQELLLLYSVENESKKYFRPYISAAEYLRQAPDLHLIKKHDSTEIGDIKTAIASLENLQKIADRNLNEQGVQIPAHLLLEVNDNFASFVPGRRDLTRLKQRALLKHGVNSR